MNYFRFGFRQMLPIMSGAVPFGIVMGASAHDAGLSVWQSSWMSIFVFAGASQLAAVDLMTQNASVFVVVATGLVINLRFILYSAAFSPFAKSARLGTKLLSAYMLTDQSYTVMSNNESTFRNDQDALTFYFGSCVCMALSWHLAVLAGFYFGNFSPKNWSLEFAVPLSFAALVVPTIKSKKHAFVAVASIVFALIFHQMPFKTGLLLAALSAMLVAVYLMKLPARKPDGTK